jgi:hypothetical protein
MRVPLAVVVVVVVVVVVREASKRKFNYAIAKNDR